jgi:iron complex outermembrane receptor protein
MIAHARRTGFVGAAALALMGAARPAAGQGACPAGRAPPAPAAGAWSGVLARVVAVEARGVPLRDALDRLAAAARVRLSYSAELLPLDRGVCLTRDRVRLGDALAELLRGTGAEAVVVGDDQVVLAPARARAAGPASSAPANDDAAVAARGARVLDRVVVTGSAAGTLERPLGVALDVLDGPALARSGGTLSQLLDGAVPGVWAWEQPPASLVARYGSIRGASSFGASAPKVYVDGIELANPLLVTRLDLDAVERVEVIRGPQGAALHGADAISGVVNIVTRHEGAPEGGVRARVRAGAGFASTDYAAGSVLAQQHGLSLRTGSARRSAGLSLDVASLGAYAPSARSRDVMATGDGRVVGARGSVTGVLRFADRRAGAAPSPVVGELLAAPQSAAAPQSVRQYTAGATGSYTADDRWTHQATLGVDGYRLASAADGGAAASALPDANPGSARGGADRLTLRAGSVARFGAAEAVAGSLTLAAEHSATRESMDAAPAALAGDAGDAGGDPAGGQGVTTTRWRSTTGLVAQGGLSLRDAYFATAGLRVERGAGTGVADLATLPMLGVAAVRAVGPASVTLRAAYGKGIRTSSTALRESGWAGGRVPLVAVGLEPEEQAGVEGGMDLLLGRALGLHVTRFDQRATGLIQPVIVGASSGWGGSDTRARRVTYLLQNVGEIDNRGWELRGTASAGRLSAAGTLSLVESRVARLAHGYTGDLRPGDRMLEVPARTASLTAAWTAPAWFASGTVSRATDWIGYDRLALASAVAGDGREPGDLAGAPLRAYWRRYEGVTRLRAVLERELGGGLTLRLAGDNLLDRQRGEPDNVTVLPGRTLTASVRADF